MKLQQWVDPEIDLGLPGPPAAALNFTTGQLDPAPASWARGRWPLAKFRGAAAGPGSPKSIFGLFDYRSFVRLMCIDHIYAGLDSGAPDLTPLSQTYFRFRFHELSSPDL